MGLLCLSPFTIAEFSFHEFPASRLPPGPPRLAPARSEAALSRPLPAPWPSDARQHHDLASLGNRVLPRC